MENKDRKIVFFDIDGTLVDGPTHQILQWRRSVNFAKMDTWHLSIRDGRW